MNVVSLKLKYASTAFLAIVLAATAFVCLFAWQLYLHSQRVESLAQAAVHVTANPGAAPATTSAARTATSIELLKRLHLVSQTDLLDGLALAAVLAGIAGLVAAWLAWRAGFRLEQPITALIRSAERFGQGDYTRPVDIVRRDELGDLQQALEHMRYKLRQTTITKNYLNSVLNGMTDAVFVSSPDGVVRIVNQAACKLLGYAEGEIQGKNIAFILEEKERPGFDLGSRRPRIARDAGADAPGSEHPRIPDRLAARQ